jgi:hypothetical protein
MTSRAGPLHAVSMLGTGARAAATALEAAAYGIEAPTERSEERND